MEYKITHILKHNHEILNYLLGNNISTDNVYYNGLQVLNINDYEYDDYINKLILSYKNISNNLKCDCIYNHNCFCGNQHTLICTNCVIKSKIINNKSSDKINNDNVDFM